MATYIPVDGRRLPQEKLSKLALALGEEGVVDEILCRKGRNSVAYKVRPGENFDQRSYKEAIESVGLIRESSYNPELNN